MGVVLQFPSKIKKSSQHSKCSFNKEFTAYGQIERRALKILKQMNSNYKSDFDWGVYDRLASRFKINPPRGGVVFKTTFTQLDDARKYSLRIDSYGRGCVHDCGFCPAKDRLTEQGYWNRPTPFPVDLLEVRRILWTVFETDAYSKYREALMSKKPIRIGANSDPCMWLDIKYKVTKELIKLFNHYNISYEIYTRSDLVATDEYIELLDKTLCTIHMGISSTNCNLTKHIEPGAPSVKRRLQAAKRLSEAGIKVIGDVTMFPIYHDGYFTGGAERKQGIVPYLDYFSFDMPEELKLSGINKIVAKFPDFTSNMVTRITNSCGICFRSFFEGVKPKKIYKFSQAEKEFYYKEFTKQCFNHKIQLTIKKTNK